MSKFKRVHPVKSAEPNAKGVFNRVNPQLNLPKLEEEILNFWDAEKIFEKSLENRKDAERFVFYEGPPFATGTPHYGHIVPNIMKDVVPRYWTMKGKLVERKWGWDCHGLPIENIAERELGIKTKKEIQEFGVAKFNEFCRSKVLSYEAVWKKVIHRLGRWVDMENSYKTMDKNFMESVWWVFKQLYDRGLIYEGYHSMHVCPRCETTLSQSEVAEGYRDVKDLSVIAEFKLTDDPTTSVLAWTTTPWTLIGNVALAVGADIKYVKIEKKDQGTGDLVRFVLAKDRLKDIFADDEYAIIEEFSGKDLVGKKYIPLFDFEIPHQSASDLQESSFTIVPADFVTTNEGTGVVHIAPAFGEDDLKLGKKLNLPFIQHVGMDGIIKPGYGHFSGLSVKPAEDIQSTDVAIIKYLVEKGTLFAKEKFEHSYPYCWRCDTPLINYATSSWFVAVEKVKPEAENLAKEISWTPNHIKNGRFGKWLEGARDWSISRQRFWASVIPIWKCQGKIKDQNANIKMTDQNAKSCGDIKVVGSVEELEKLSGKKVDDLHKHIVDEITFPCEKCGGEMRRIPDVLDTWFDSGSMPYAQIHYPFNPSSISSQSSDNYGAGNKEKFEKNFPADFIAEGVDQTRAWFYYLHIISTAIFQKPVFKNAIANGIVLAKDGKKMSKKLNNYPDPQELFEKYGADVMRIYLLSSPVMTAENLNFSETEMLEYSRGFFRMIWNSYYFFTMYAKTENWSTENFGKKSKNILDNWILAKAELLNFDIEKSMKKYDLVAATRLFLPFVSELSNWYIRRNRKRFWKNDDADDKNSAFATLYQVLIKLAKMLAPFLPFISEEIYKNLTGEVSVHLADFPEVNKESIDQNLLEKMEQVRKIVETGLAARDDVQIRVRQPLESLKYSGEKLPAEFEEIIADEVNVKKVIFDPAISVTVILDSRISDELRQEGDAREIIRLVQQLRKRADFQIDDKITIYFQSENLSGIFQKFSEMILDETLSGEFVNSREENLDAEIETKISKNTLWLGIEKSRKL
ncbi:MAG: isoleucine--tRNA ligase [Candidatus Berkelbacteria bacterium]|nr:isoleucine--tRNA ligase [Candidatus Berkelbacteria bacterium]